LLEKANVGLGNILFLFRRKKDRTPFVEEEENDKNGNVSKRICFHILALR